MPEPIFNKLGMNIMVPEPISVAYFINPSHQSVSICVSTVTARLSFGKNVTAATDTCNNRRIVGCVVGCADHVVGK
jgi:hypothetical protein